MEFSVLAIASAAVLGILVGSFLNVVILRLPLRMQWQWERDAREAHYPDMEGNASSGIVVERSP